jgi:hypothetical protein
VKVTIGNGFVEIDGPTPDEVRTSAERFEHLFGVYPVIRLSGHFPANAAERGPLHLRNDSYRVVAVAVRFLLVDLGSGVPQSWVDPTLGTNVKVRLLLPKD